MADLDTSLSAGKRCDQCKFWRGPKPEEMFYGHMPRVPSGECRRNAPVPPLPPQDRGRDGVVYFNPDRVFPIVMADDWCGEHVFATREKAAEWYKSRNRAVPQ